MNWKAPWKREQPKALVTAADLSGFFPNLSTGTTAAVGEHHVLGLSGFYRAATLIAGSLASMPLRSQRTKEDGEVESVASVFDNPDSDNGQTVYEWKETVFVHLLIHGNAYALKLRNEAGGLARLQLVHPLAVRIQLPTPSDYRKGDLPAGGKWFWVQLANGQEVRYDANDVWHVPGISLNGFWGVSLIHIARMSLNTAMSGDKAANTMFSKGALISGIVSPVDDDLEVDEVKELRKALDSSFSGHENAGRIAIASKRLSFNPWTQSASDAQFLQSRQFQIEEISRWTGVPPHLLMQTEKQTSWGTGVEEQNRALGRTVLGPWANRFEERASRLLPRPRYVKFDFAGLERPSPDKETELLISKVQAGLITRNEARKVLQLPPVEGGDVLLGQAPAPQHSGNGDGNAQ